MGHLTQDSVQTLLTHAYNARVASGFASAWGYLDPTASPSVVTYGTHSWAASALPVTPNHSLFDLASLTKIISGGTFFFSAYDHGEFSLDESLGDCLGIDGPSRSVVLRDLLTHTSGFPAIAEIGLLQSYMPSPSQLGKVLYSDVGFLWLNQVFLRHTGRTIEDWFETEIKPRLRVGSTLGYRPLPEFLGVDSSCVATEVHPSRGLIQGQVHDDNTYALGGASFHAGLFGSLNDVIDWCKCFFSGAFCSPRTLRLLLKNWNAPGTAPRAIAWDMPPGDGSGSTGKSLKGAAFGHLGFTGTSLWVDLDRGRYAILLTNRVHPTRNDPESIRNLRRAFHATVFDT